MTGIAYGAESDGGTVATLTVSTHEGWLRVGADHRAGLEIAKAIANADFEENLPEVQFEDWAILGSVANPYEEE